MAPAASVALIVPERQEDVDSSTEDKRKKIEEEISSLESWRARCSEKLADARRGHVTGNSHLRCLEFVESELRYILEHSNKALSSQHVDDRTMVQCLEVFTQVTSEALFRAQYHFYDPQDTLLERATQCFHRRIGSDEDTLFDWLTKSSYYWTQSGLVNFHHLTERSYMHLSIDISRLGLPRQVAEEGGGFHAVGFACFEPSPHTSYDHFLYGSYLLTLCMIMFPYGYKFEKDRLVQKLMCEAGLSYHESSETEEEVQRYFSDVVNRSAINHAATNSRLGNADEAGAWQWNVNQIQHQLLASKSAEIGFAFTSHTLNLLASASATDHGNKASRTPRRLALYHNDPDIPSLLQNVDLSQTRSLAVSGGVVSRSVPLDRFINLVVLDVEGWDNFGDEDLLRICTSKMFFLVYLSIRSTRVSKVPQEIKDLCSLQVLDASSTRVTELQLGVFEGTKLHSLDIRGTPISKLAMAKQTLELKYSLGTLLLGSEGMVKSVETATSLPHDIQCLRWLNTLATVDLSEQPTGFINALGELSHLRVLAITWSFHQSSDRDYREALLSSIKKWADLKSLTIHCGLGCSMEFLGSLSGQPQKLEKFKVIAGRFAAVPQWFHGLRHLSFVQITVCKLEPHDLEILRDLSKLKCIVLGLDFIPKQAIVIHNEGFHELQRFSIECPLPRLFFESGAMPKLKYLQLEFPACPTSTVSVPMGINNLRCLVEVALWYNVRYANSSSVMRTVEAVREEVSKCRNATKVVSLLINGTEQDDVQAVHEETKSATKTPSGTGAGAQDAIEEADEITEA
ncbi:hypothetical protein HU200_048810 [Digitaria exilis]|uniref:Disease resistance R13L4/SHOC-2-like LRR domain-containing protein n=1 Tax=Digitaria exilis TaxID=1010633 RepID=A0A835B0S6_9POAL|nr:hypothetical protein HU200_048810 [Digitaria exilis]